MKKGNGRAWSLPAGIGWGVGAAMIWTILGAIATGKLIDGEWINQESVGYAAMIILITSAWLGSGIAYQKTRIRKAMVCGLAGVGYFLALLSVTALFFGGQYQAVGVTALLIGCGSILAILTGNRAGKGRTRKRQQNTVRKIVHSDHR